MRNKNSGKVAVIGVTALAIVVMLLLIVPGSAAQVTVDYVGIITPGGDCTLLDGDQQPFEISNEEAKIEGENGTPGSILLQCDQIAEPGELGAEKWNSGNTQDSNGLPTQCFVGTQDFGSATDDWNVIVSASGNVKLTCHFGDQFD